MKVMLFAVTLVCSVAVGQVLFAGTGMKTKNPRVNAEECTISGPLDGSVIEETCEEVPAPPQSGIRVFFCDDVHVVVCPEEK